MKKILHYSCSLRQQMDAPDKIKSIAEAVGLSKHTMTYSGYFFPGEVRYVIVAEGTAEDIKLFEEAMEAL